MLNLTYYGHSVLLLSDGVHKVIIDPFINDNPQAPVKADEIDVQYILLTHGHGDHLGDTIAIAKQRNAEVIATFELANYCASKGVRNVHQMNVGGAHTFPFGRVKLTPAHHSSSTPDGHYTGDPYGLIVEMGGRTIYHTGDTALFLDMKLIGEMNRIDVMFVCAGDNFTMGIDDAAKAAEFVKPAVAVPIHYNTFPEIRIDPVQFIKKLPPGVDGKIMNPGDTLTL